MTKAFHHVEHGLRHREMLGESLGHSLGPELRFVGRCGANGNARWPSSGCLETLREVIEKQYVRDLQQFVSARREFLVERHFDERAKLDCRGCIACFKEFAEAIQFVVGYLSIEAHTDRLSNR